MRGILAQVCFLCGIFQTVRATGIPIILDTAFDVFELSLAITGKFEYLRNGNLLLEYRDKLPNEFEFDHFDGSNGIWAVFPKSQREACTSVSDIEDLNVVANRVRRILEGDKLNVDVCDVSALARFWFKSDRSMTWLTIRYHLGGNATIRITDEYSLQPYEIFASQQKSDNWEEYRADISFGKRVLVETIVNRTGDYVLIDRITIETLEQIKSTTERPPRIMVPTLRFIKASAISPSTASAETTTTTPPILCNGQPPIDNNNVWLLSNNFLLSGILLSLVVLVVLLILTFFVSLCKKCSINRNDNV